MRHTKLVAASVSASLLLAACGGTDGGTTDSQGSDTTTDGTDDANAAGCTDLKIGAVHPLTGGLALDGEQMDNAAKLAAEDLSTDGVTIEILSADSQGQPEVGQTEAQRLIEDGAHALIGAFQSAVTTNLATLAQREQVPLVIDVAVSDEITSESNDYVFRIQPNATAMGVFGARYLQEISEAAGDPIASVAYMHEETSFGTSVFDAFRAEAENLGIEIAEEIVYNAFEVQDVTTEMQRVAGSGADALVVTGYYNDGVLIANAAASVRPDIKVIYGVAQGAYDLPQFPDDAPDVSEGILDSNYHFDATDPRVEDVRSRFEEQHGAAMRTAAVLAYQAVEVIAEAAKGAASCDGPDLQAAIQDVEVSDPLLTFPGPITFDDTGENENAQPVVMQVQEGQIVQVYPSEFSEAEVRFPALPWSE